MSKNGRWISKELDHLNKYMKDLGVDVRAGNMESAKTNWGMAMGVVGGMVKREGKTTRNYDRMSGLTKWIYRRIKPLLREVGKEAIREYTRELRR